jgi:UDP-N-acetylmuramoyl-tripeptide--D-alanyl-D-alanine ligase
MNVDKIYLCGGSVMEQAYAIVPEENRGAYFRTAQDLIPIVLRDVGDGDIVLVKGSKGSRVSCVAESILKQNQKRG